MPANEHPTSGDESRPKGMNRMGQNAPKAVGIDLGTTFSVIAYLDDEGRPKTISNAEGELTTPSVVLFDANDIVVGKEAVAAAVLEPNQVAQFAKRELGNLYFSRQINGESFPPEVIQSLILEKLKQDAEVVIGPISEAVVTVPAYFNEPRRKATQDAGRLIGLKVLDIINEPTAAAISYGVQNGFLTDTGESKRNEKVLIYDLGGGTFDATLMEIDGKKYTAIATDGNFMLGGMDWDRRIVDFTAQSFMAKFGTDPRTDPAGMQRLLCVAEAAKRSLSVRNQFTINFEHAGAGLRLPLTRGRFEELTADLLDRTRFTIRNLLRTCGASWDDITRLLLVGGSTRMPMIAEMLQLESGKQVDRSLSADEAVAHGAAIYAGLILSGSSLRHTDLTVTNVNSHSLGVLGFDPATGRPRSQVMIPANTPLPVKKTCRFNTKEHGQTDVVVNVIEGGDASGRNSTPIGKCVVQGLPTDVPSGAPVDVTFQYSANGRLAIHASLPSLKAAAAVEIERASGLSKQTIGEWKHRIREGIRPSANSTPRAHQTQAAPTQSSPLASSPFNTAQLVPPIKPPSPLAQPTSAPNIPPVAHSPPIAPPGPPLAQPTISSPVSPPPLPTTPHIPPLSTAPRPIKPPPLATADNWYLQDDESEVFGPMPKSEIDEWVIEGRVRSTFLLRKDGWDDWRSATEIYPVLTSQGSWEGNSEDESLFIVSNQDSAISRTEYSGKKRKSNTGPLASLAGNVAICVLVFLPWMNVRDNTDRPREKTVTGMEVFKGMIDEQDNDKPFDEPTPFRFKKPPGLEVLPMIVFPAISVLAAIVLLSDNRPNQVLANVLLGAAAFAFIARAYFHYQIDSFISQFGVLLTITWYPPFFLGYLCDAVAAWGAYQSRLD